MKRGNAAMLVVLGARRASSGVLAYLLVSPFVGAVRNLIEDLPNIVERIRASELFQQLDERTDIGDEAPARAESLAADLPSKLGDAFEVGGRIFGFGLGAVTIVFMTLFLVIDLPNLSRSLHSVLFPRDVLADADARGADHADDRPLRHRRDRDRRRSQARCRGRRHGCSACRSRSPSGSSRGCSGSSRRSARRSPPSSSRSSR